MSTKRRSKSGPPPAINRWNRNRSVYSWNHRIDWARTTKKSTGARKMLIGPVQETPQWENTCCCASTGCAVRVSRVGMAASCVRLDPSCPAPGGAAQCQGFLDQTASAVQACLGRIKTKMCESPERCSFSSIQSWGRNFPREPVVELVSGITCGRTDRETRKRETQQRYF